MGLSGEFVALCLLLAVAQKAYPRAGNVEGILREGVAHEGELDQVRRPAVHGAARIDQGGHGPVNVRSAR